MFCFSCDAIQQFFLEPNALFFQRSTTAWLSRTIATILFLASCLHNWKKVLLQSYEISLNYNTIILLRNFFSTRRLFGQTGDSEGLLLYDRLQRAMPARSVSSVGFPQLGNKTVATEFHGEHSRRWTSLDELRFHREPVYDEIVRCESPEMGAEMECTLKRHRRRFSIDLGEVREFIAITEEMLSSAEENTTSFTELETFQREDIC